MVKVTGRTRGGDHLRAHLNYISRHGALEMDGADGARLTSRAAVAEIAEAWIASSVADSRTRVNSPLSLSIVLSMPRGAEAIVVRDAARAWAAAAFGERHDHVLALHTDAGHPHVHVAVCARGAGGERLNPKKADLEAWRQLFAQALRDRGIEAEATPRRARGVTRKPERTALRKIRERHEGGEGPPSRTLRSAYKSAAMRAFGARQEPEPWERRILERQRQVRALYLAQARLMQRSAHAFDKDLGFRLEAFVRAMPAPDTQALALARELREVGGLTRSGEQGRDRGR
jgi:type IV secretory pathway VirD2 relaxase